MQNWQPHQCPTCGQECRPIGKLCAHCGKELHGPPSRIRAARYCSLVCRDAAIRARQESSVEKFWRHVVKADGCWEWRGYINPHGYGQFSRKENGKTLLYLAHRVSYELAHGPIGQGMSICHACDNTRCVNPAHVFAGTPRENTQDALRKGRLRRAPRGQFVA